MNLTPSRLRVLLSIRELYADRGYSPTIREVGQRLGWTSTNHVHNQIGWLKMRGYLAQEPHVNRTLRLTIVGRVALDTAEREGNLPALLGQQKTNTGERAEVER